MDNTTNFLDSEWIPVEHDSQIDIDLGEKSGHAYMEYLSRETKVHVLQVAAVKQAMDHDTPEVANHNLVSAAKPTVNMDTFKSFMDVPNVDGVFMLNVLLYSIMKPN